MFRQNFLWLAQPPPPCFFPFHSIFCKEMDSIENDSNFQSFIFILVLFLSLVGFKSFENLLPCL